MSFNPEQLAEDTNKLEMTGEEAVRLWREMSLFAQGDSSEVFRETSSVLAHQVLGMVLLSSFCVGAAPVRLALSQEG